MVKIIDYRGYEIFFNIDEEKFYLHSEKYDRDSWVSTLKAAKANIDNYIKSNSDFKPFWVVRVPGKFYGSSVSNTLKIVGIRKDGNFVQEDVKAGKLVVSKYDEESWMSIKDENNEVMELLAVLELKQKELDKQRKELQGKVVVETLSDIRKIKYQDI